MSAFVALAFGVLALDRASGADGVDWAFHGSAAAARDILSTIAGSLITVSGLAFSLTIVTLQLVSSQFSPRALRGFLNDRVNQALAGTFVGIFIYCLIVLSSIRSPEPPEDAGFLPALAVSVAIVGGVVGFAALLVFIHRIAQSVKAATITAKAGRETLAAIDRLYRGAFEGPTADDADALVASWAAAGEPARVRSQRPGYVQAIAVEKLAESVPGDVRLHVRVRPGDFVTERDALAEIWPRQAVDERVERRVRSDFHVSNERDVRQDPAYGLRQLVDVALRAISPGINDPTTALNCVRYVEAALERLATRALPPRVRRLGAAEAVVATVAFEEYVELAFIEIGRYATGDARVVGALLAALETVAAAARDAGANDRAAAVVAAAEDIAGPALADARTDRDRASIAERLERVRRAAASASD